MARGNLCNRVNPMSKAQHSPARIDVSRPNPWNGSCRKLQPASSACRTRVAASESAAPEQCKEQSSPSSLSFWCGHPGENCGLCAESSPGFMRAPARTNSPVHHITLPWALKNNPT